MAAFSRMAWSLRSLSSFRMSKVPSVAWSAGIVFVFIIAVAGLSAYIGYRKVRQVRAPQRTIDTTKSTVAALRHPHQQT